MLINLFGNIKVYLDLPLECQEERIKQEETYIDLLFSQFDSVGLIRVTRVNPRFRQ